MSSEDRSQAMEHQSLIESLPAEVFRFVIKALPTSRDLSALLSCSKELRYKVTPYLYSDWEHFGYRFFNGRHQTKHLTRFLRTIINKPELAAHVKTLDLRNWWCLNTRCNGFIHAFREEEMEYDARARENYLNPDNKKVLFRAIKRAGYTNGDAHEEMMLLEVANYEDMTISLLVSNLPNLDTLLLVPGGQTDFVNIFHRLSSHRTSYTCPIKNIYMADFSFTAVDKNPEKCFNMFPIHLTNYKHLFSLPKLETLAIMRPVVKETTKFAVLGKTSIDHLHLEAAKLEINHVLRILNIQRSLKTFSWSQKYECKSTCVGPIYCLLGLSLRPHHNTLEKLDLKLQSWNCRIKNHAGNPMSNFESVENNRRWSEVAGEHVIWGQDAHLLGSLKEFKVLKYLTVEPIAVFGDPDWGFSTREMHKILPASLEVLTLIMHNHNLSNGRFCIEQLANLIRQAPSKLRNLKQIVVTGLAFDIVHLEGTAKREERLSAVKKEWESLKTDCLSSSIDLKLLSNLSHVGSYDHLSSIPCFRQLLEYEPEPALDEEESDQESE